MDESHAGERKAFRGERRGGNSRRLTVFGTERRCIEQGGRGRRDSGVMRTADRTAGIERGYDPFALTPGERERVSILLGDSERAAMYRRTRI